MPAIPKLPRAVRLPPTPKAKNTTIHFDAQWGETPNAKIVAGGKLTLTHELERVGKWANTTSHNGFPTWQAKAVVEFSPGGRFEKNIIEFRQQSPGSNLGARAEAVPVTFEVPKNAKSVKIYFESTGMGQGGPQRGWDSDLGKDYTFPVSPK